jgi:hypothetical protein
MYRYPIIAVMIVVLFSHGVLALVNTGLSYIDYYLQSEYRNDTIDYDENEKNYFREKAIIRFSEKSSLNLAYVYIDKNDDRRFTWSLVLRDVSPSVSFILGHYYVNFGNGLLIGGKSAYNPDIFSQRGKIKRDRNFSPCKSGNPTFAFRGIALSYNERVEDVGISVSTFYSLKKRYIDEDSYEEGATSSNLNSIEYRDNRDFKYHEPVEVRTHGSEFALDLMDLFHFQVHYIYTDVWSYNNREIYWDNRKRGDSESGISNLIGIGYGIQYGDDFIRIFFENDITSRSLSDNGNKKVDSSGYGILYGAALRHPIVTISLIVKNTNKDYYTPYESSMGSGYPEEGWFFNGGVKLGREVKLGAATSYEKKTSINSRDVEIPVIRKEEFYMSYSSRPINRCTMTLKRVEKKEYGDNWERIQLKSGVEIDALDKCSITLSAIYQNGEDIDSSELYTGGIKMAVIPYVRSTLSVGRARISESNNIYAVISPIRYANVRGIFIRRESSLFVMKTDVEFKKISLSVRCLYQFDRGKILQRRLDLFGSGYF